MKRILLTLVLVMLFAIGANAQSEMNLSARVGGGVTMPMGDAGDVFKMGFGGGAGFSVQFHPMFAAVGKVEYFMLPYDTDADLDDGTAIFFGADVHFYPPIGEPGESPFAPYILAGAGMTSFDPGNDGESSTEFTYQFGGGFEYMFSPKMAGFVEVKYATISGDIMDVNHLPILGGIKFLFGAE